MQRSIVFVLFMFTFWSCKKDSKNSSSTSNGTPVVQTNSVNFKISNVVGSMPLALSTQTYINQNQDTFTVNIFRYYISNIKLKRDDGYQFIEPNSYRLVSQNDSQSQSFTIQNIPLGNYISMEFIIGVDSARNCSGAQTGVLDPINDMFWDWSQGYIFAKLRGTSNSVPGGSYFNDIGGFSGQWNAIVKSYPSFGSNMIQIASNRAPKVFMKADVLEWFKNPQIIDLASYYAVTTGKKAHEIAGNYANMFSVTSIAN